MPAASIDFTLAALAIILVVVGSVYGVNMAAEPYMEEVDDEERHQQIGRYILLSQGEPANWGTGAMPTSLGLASGGDPYELDIDKVTRLNPTNAYAVDYSDLWRALGIDDVSFRIEVGMLFNVTLSLSSYQDQGSDTVYAFSATTTRDGYPVPTQVSYYVAISDSTYNNTGTTDVSGSGSVEFTLPNSLSGTALLIGIAETVEPIVSYGVLPFAHNSGYPNAPGGYATLSPLNYVLKVDLTPGATPVDAAVFTLEYTFDLTASGSDYIIPRLLDRSPMVLVLTGVNGSTYWVEWAAYPQAPLAVGADMDDDYIVSGVAHNTYVVEIKGALYRLDTSFRGLVKND